MHQALNTMTAPMFLTGNNCLQFLNKKIVDMALNDIGDDWRAIYQQFEDKFNYLSISIYKRTNEETPIVSIEIGVLGVDTKRPVGAFVAYWDREANEVTTLDTIILNSRSCSLDTFVVALLDYVVLPSVGTDVVDNYFE